jgi:hypothetical protein
MQDALTRRLLSFALVIGPSGSGLSGQHRKQTSVVRPDPTSRMFFEDWFLEEFQLFGVFASVCILSLPLTVGIAYVTHAVAGLQWANVVFSCLLAVSVFAIAGNVVHVARACVARLRAKRAALRNRYWAVEPTSPPVPIPPPDSFLLSSDRDLVVQAVVALLISVPLVVSSWP